MKCYRCGKKTTDVYLCPKCYNEFTKWSHKNFFRVAKLHRNAIEVWIDECRENEA